MQDDLSLATTDDLLDELLRRFDCAVFAGCRDHCEDEDGRVVEMREYRQHGQMLACVGLANWIGHIILRDAIAGAREYDG